MSAPSSKRDFKDVAAIGIGHNGAPDEFVTLAAEVANLREEAKHHLDGVAVTTQGQCDALDTLYSLALKLEQKADAARKEARKEADQIIAQVQARYKPLVDQAERIKIAARAGTVAWKQHRADLTAIEAARIADEARNARETAEREAQAARRANDLDRIEAAEGQLANADVLTAMAKKAAKIPKAGLRTYWTGTVNDYAAYLEWVRENRLPALIDFMDEQLRRDVAAGARVIPGCVIGSEKR